MLLMYKTKKKLELYFPSSYTYLTNQSCIFQYNIFLYYNIMTAVPVLPFSQLSDWMDFWQVQHRALVKHYQHVFVFSACTNNNILHTTSFLSLFYLGIPEVINLMENMHFVSKQNESTSLHITN